MFLTVVRLELFERTIVSTSTSLTTSAIVSGVGERIIIATGTGDLVSGNSVLGDATRKVVYISKRGRS